MRPSQLVDRHRDLIRQLALRHRVANLRVFGSTARGLDTEASDLDLLVDPLPGTTLLDLGGLQIELEETLGIAVDVVTPKDLPPAFREQALASAVLL